MHAGAFVVGDVFYVLGGFDVQSVWDDVQKATVSADGTISAREPAGTLPGPRSHFATTRVGDYVYLTGGLDKSAFNNPPDLKTVVRGHVATDGSLGEWATMTALPVGFATHGSFAYGGYLYVAGGISATGQEKRVYRAPFQSDHGLERGRPRRRSPARAGTCTPCRCSGITCTRCPGRSTTI